MNPDALQNRVAEEIETLRDELIASTSRILQFESVSGSVDTKEAQRHEREMEACAKFLRTLSKDLGFTWREKKGKWCCVEWPAAERPDAPANQKPPVIGILAHIDVVPAGGTWTHPPFSGTVAYGAVWGRGAVDMKGPLMACLYALHALRRAEFRPPVTYRLIIGTQEEIIDWSDLDDYFAAEGTPDFGFTPDACFPVVIGEKGTMILGMEGTWVEKEEGSGASWVSPVSLQGGTRGNVVPDCCGLQLRFPAPEETTVRDRLEKKLEDFRITYGEAAAEIRKVSDSPHPEERQVVVAFHGRSAHGSTPEKGHNAVLDGLRFVLSLGLAPSAFLECVRFLYEAGRNLTGARLGLESAHPFLGPTTINLGVVRLEPGSVEAVLNVRPTLGLSIEEARRRIAAAAEAFSPRFDFRWRFAPIHQTFEAQLLDTETLGPFLAGLQEGLERVTGEHAPYAAIPYTTYAKAMPNCCAFGPILHSAGEIEMAHEPDERVAIDALVRNTRIFALALACAGLNVAS
jgi:succinyl-diaminopimelate desuccinylase